MKAIRRFTVAAMLPGPLAPLSELMLNLRWSWHPQTTDLFAAIDPQRWEECGHDPIRLLGEVSPARLAQLAEDPEFLRRLAGASEDLDEYLSGRHWYQAFSSLAGGGNNGPAGPAGSGETAGNQGPAGNGAPAAIAYFSPEYGITAVLPQYSGGLGILAGDHLKTASDLGVPLIGVGLLYRHGYFTQSLSAEGWQEERYPVSDPNGMPLTLLREAGEGGSGDGQPVRVTVSLPEGRRLAAQVWVAQVGRVPLLLLDSHVEDNEPALRQVTDRLYGGGGEHRLRQELLLGIGGVRAVRAYCAITSHPAPEVFHTNEGHAGFLGLERIREYMAEGLSFDEAQEACRAGTVFTTHTPVPAGIDRFPRTLVERYLCADGCDAGSGGLPADRVLALGAETYPGGDPEVFNMAVMGMRLAQRVNGVSRLHGEVSREMFGGLWPGFDVSEVPVGYVTNGVHAPTWVAREVLDLARAEIGPELTERARGWERIAGMPGESIWELGRLLRGRLVALARQRLHDSWRQRGSSEAELSWIGSALDEDALTIGFARRVPSYKRLTLMLRDPGRLRALLLDPDRPVQIVIAGKAHPADESGKRLIQQMVQFADDPEVRHRIVFLPDYDMALAQALVQGCDVWMNNPIRPLEASGTSGMKAALNGGLNLSIRDGWWDEWFDGTNGWEIPSAAGVEDADRRDELEATALYELIGQHVVPLFYDRDADGFPRRWVEMVKHTLSSLGPKVLASRMVREYVTELYAPAARASRALAAPGPSGEPYGAARELAAWKQRMIKAWPGVRVEHVDAGAAAGGELRLGSRLNVRATVALGGIRVEDVTVELVYGRAGEEDEIVDPRHAVLTALDAHAPEEAGADSGSAGVDAGGDGAPRGVVRFGGSVELERPGPFGYTVRVLPRHPLLPVPADLGLVALPEAPAGLVNGDLR